MFVGRSRQMLEKFWKSATAGNAMDLFGFYKIKFQRHAKALHFGVGSDGFPSWVWVWRQVHLMVRLDPLSEFSACGVSLFQHFPSRLPYIEVYIYIHRYIESSRSR